MRLRSLRISVVAFFSLMVVAIAVAAPRAASLPPNDINCKDWTHNPDGSWSSSPNTPGMSNDRLFPGVHVISRTKSGSSYDVLDVLEKKCARKR